MTTPTVRDRTAADPLVRAIVRYIAALERRYPDGPRQLRAELDGRGKVSDMPTTDRREAAP